MMNRLKHFVFFRSDSFTVYTRVLTGTRFNYIFFFYTPYDSITLAATRRTNDAGLRTSACPFDILPQLDCTGVPVSLQSARSQKKAHLSFRLVLRSDY